MLHLNAILAVASLMTPSPAYGYVADADRFVSLFQERTYLVGRLDSAGHFNEYYRVEMPPHVLGVINSDWTVEQLPVSNQEPRPFTSSALVG